RVARGTLSASATSTVLRSFALIGPKAIIVLDTCQELFYCSLMKNSKKRVRALQKVRESLALQRPPGSSVTGNDLLDYVPPIGGRALDSAPYRKWVRELGGKVQKVKGEWCITWPPSKRS